VRLLVLADGSSIHTERWLRGLSSSGPVDLHLLTMNPAGLRPGLTDIAAISSIHEIYAGPIKEGGSNWRYLLNIPRVVRTVRRVRPDAIVAIYLSSYGLMGAITKGDAALVHVMIGSDVMVAPSRHWTHRLLSRFILSRGDLFVSASAAITTKLTALARIPIGSILTQQYGLEDWLLDHPPARKAYGFVSNRAWLANSNIPMLLRIFGRIESPSSLALVGDGGPLESQIRQLARRDSRVVTLGVLSHRQNVEVVAQSEFYFSMTASDGASLSLMEGLALGAIPVVSDIEPNREWVEQDVNGVLVPLDDEAFAAARIESLLAMPVERLEAMRVRNRAMIRERGSLTRNMTTFRVRLGEVLAQRRGGHS
jgi:hypothetical protein